MKITKRKQGCIYKEDPNFDSLLEIAPNDPQAIEKSKKNLEGRFFEREQLSDILYQYNKDIGNDSIALEQAKRLKEENVFCVVTGQQPGFMGGPFYTILKAISCVLLAKEINAIPVFWVASEDHDVAEVDHTYSVDLLGNLKHHHISLPKHGMMLEDIKLSKENLVQVDEFFKLLGLNKEKYLPELAEGYSYSKMFAVLMSRLFSGTGLLLIEPKKLRRLSKSFFEKEIKEAEQIQKILSSSKQVLENIGGKVSLDIKEGTQLFIKSKDGRRKRLKYQEGKYFTVTPFEEKQLSLEELLAIPLEHFSTNVVSRTVMQNLLFPVLAYIAGPSEINYHRQLKEYHHFHGIKMPLIYPRLTATVVPSDIRRQLEIIDLKPWDQIPEKWVDLMPALKSDIVNIKTAWKHAAMKGLSQELTDEKIERLVNFAMEKLEKEACKARLKRIGVSYPLLHMWHNVKNPHNQPQERVLNALYFQALVKEQHFVEQLLDKLNPHNFEHHYIEL